MLHILHYCDAQITKAGCCDHNLWQLVCILTFSHFSSQLSEIKGLTIWWCSLVTAVVTTHTQGQACKIAGHLNTFNLVSFVALSGLDHTNTQRNIVNKQKTKPGIMKVFTAASMLASVLCLPEPEAGFGVEDMATLSRCVSYYVMHNFSTMSVPSAMS